MHAKHSDCTQTSELMTMAVWGYAGSRVAGRSEVLLWSHCDVTALYWLSAAGHRQCPSVKPTAHNALLRNTASREEMRAPSPDNFMPKTVSINQLSSVKRLDLCRINRILEIFETIMHSIEWRFQVWEGKREKCRTMGFSAPPPSASLLFVVY